MTAAASITVTPIHVADLLVEGELMPVCVRVIEHPDARVLVDTGMTELHPAAADLDPRLRPQGRPPSFARTTARPRARTRHDTSGRDGPGLAARGGGVAPSVRHDPEEARWRRGRSVRSRST